MWLSVENGVTWQETALERWAGARLEGVHNWVNVRAEDERRGMGGTQLSSGLGRGMGRVGREFIKTGEREEQETGKMTNSA